MAVKSIIERLPFEIAISDPKLLKPRWDMLSGPQQTVLRAFYGLPLSDEQLVWWSILQGGATYNDLFEPVSVTLVPYVPKEYKKLVAILGRRAGKALALDTPIPTPSGWTDMEALEVGDYVFDEHGKPCRVTFVTDVQWDRPCYRITFSDGHSITADGDHQWFVWSKAARKAIKEPYRKARPEIRTTSQLIDTLHVGVESNWAISLAQPVEYPTKQQPLDPYLLGTYLGDGHTHNARITNVDDSIIEAWHNSPFELRQHSDDPITYSINGGLRALLQELGILGHKCIPDVYLYGDREQRIALVQGMIDSDGYVTKKGVEFYNINLLLANQFKTLVESLGCRATIRQKIAKLYGKDCGLVYTVEFQASFPVCRLERKLRKQRLLTEDKQRFRYIQSIEPVASVPVKCIQVDSPSHLYLAGQGFIPTHNTDMIVSTAAAYEAVLGGHKKYVRPGQEFKLLWFAQSKNDAMTTMNFAKLAMEDSPLLKGEIHEAIASEIRLKNGLVIEPVPVGKAVGRGHAVPVVVMDEAGFWYSDPNAANPDFEVLRAVSYSQLQFPDAKIFIPSTPWAEQGILWDAYKAGTEGRKLQCDACKKKANFICEHPLDAREKHTDMLMVHASTAAMQNPLITRKRLIEIRREDPEAYPRESGAQFIKSVSGWLNGKKIEQSIDPGTYQREPLKDGRVTYVACIDPAFRKDSFAMTIGHHDAKQGIVQDFIRYWEPLPGEPLNPSTVLDEIKQHLDHYGISTVYSDQHQLESLQQLALDRNFTINGYDFTGTSKAKICGSFKVVIDNNRLRLLEHELQKEQLEKLQRQVLQAGHIRIAAPPGKHDDLAMVLILMCRIVMWLIGEDAKQEEKPKTIDNDHVKLAMESLQRKRREAAAMLEDD